MIRKLWQRLPVASGVAAAATGLLATFRPDLILNRNLPTGGDMGAHHYIAKSLASVFPKRLWAWGSGWYAGMPILHFYFPLPYAAILLLSTVLPYPVAFKIIATAGVASLPASIYFCLKMLGADRVTAAFGLAFGLVYIYNDSYTILGGNIDSTMAGEFAYAISLSLVLVVIGVTYRRLVVDERRDLSALALPAALLGAAALTHVLPLPAAGAAFLAMMPGRKWIGRLWRLSATGIAGAGTASALLLPLLMRMDYTAHPIWKPSRGIAVFAGGPACAETCRWSPAAAMMVAFAAAAVIVALIRRDRWVAVPAAIAAAGGVGVALWPAGAVWNLRWLPLFYLGCALLASYTCGQIIGKIGDRTDSERRALGSAAIAIAGIAAFAMLTSYFAPSWVAYNYSGYQSKPGWDEYSELMSALATLDDARILWEYSDKYQDFGTTRALELIPYWTDKRTMEGLLIESSITAPGHFIMQSETSLRGTGAVPGLSYPGFDFESGLEHMELYGIGYFVAFSDEVKAAARTNGLVEVAVAGRFTVFEVETAGEVVVPEYEPVRGDPEKWRERSLQWLENPSAPIVFPQAGTGPRASALSTDGGGGAAPAPLAVSQEAHVSVTRPRDGVIEFHTNQLGQPHIVKESWFPTWSAEGAEGPYLVAPSLMLVFPTQETVRMVEKPRGLDHLAWAISAVSLAVIALAALSTRLRLAMLARQPRP